MFFRKNNSKVHSDTKELNSCTIISDRPKSIKQCRFCLKKEESYNYESIPQHLKEILN